MFTDSGVYGVTRVLVGRTPPHKPRMEVRHQPRPDVEVRGSSGFRIVLHSAARDVIDFTLRDHRDELVSGYEVGGWLFSAETGVESWRTRLEVGSASGLGNGDSKRNAVRLDAREADRIDSQLQSTLRTTGELLAGCWHSHPDDDGYPSNSDLRSWLGAWQVLNGRSHSRAHYLSLIVTPDGVGNRWLVPKLHGWVVHREGFSEKMLLEPAQVV